MKNYDYKDETKDVKGKVGHRQKYKILPHEQSNFNCSSKPSFIFANLISTIID